MISSTRRIAMSIEPADDQSHEKQCADSSDTLTHAQVGDLVNENMREYDDGDPILESYQKYRS